MFMAKWLFILSLFSCSTLANQLAIEVIEGAYPKLTFRIEALERLELKAQNQASKNDQEQVLQISLPSSSACITDNLQLLKGRLIALEFAWDPSIQQQIFILSQGQLWKDLPYRILIPSSSPSCQLPNIELDLPSLSAFSEGWGRVNVNEASGVDSHNFFVVQQIGNSYQFNLVSPNHTKAQHYWLKFYAQ
jgi:hypothetical protein